MSKVRNIIRHINSKNHDDLEAHMKAIDPTFKEKCNISKREIKSCINGNYFNKKKFNRIWKNYHVLYWTQEAKRHWYTATCRKIFSYKGKPVTVLLDNIKFLNTNNDCSKPLGFAKYKVFSKRIDNVRPGIKLMFSARIYFNWVSKVSKVQIVR